MSDMEDRNIYQDIAERTQGDIYVGQYKKSGINLFLTCI